MSSVAVKSWCEEHRFLPCDCTEAARAHKPNKYGAKKVKLDGFTFDSAREARNYQAAKVRESAGEIRELEVHPKSELKINGIKVGTYTADLRYFEASTGQYVIEDTKSRRRSGKRASAKARKFSTKRLSAFRIKVFEALFGVKVRIV